MKRSRVMSFIDLAGVEATVQQRGWTMRDFLDRAKINESTWYRWKNPKSKTKPNTATLEKVNKALARLPQK